MPGGMLEVAMTAEPRSSTQGGGGIAVPSARSSRRRSKRAGRRRWARRLTSAFMATAVAVLALGLAGVGYELALPSVSDAPARVAAIVHAHHGQLARLPLPGKLARSLVAVEDEHFYSNVAVNVLDGAGRAALASMKARGDPGGSTIAQQLAKQLYPHRSGLGGTLEEIGLGVKLSLSYSKPQILEMYLNAVYFGNGYWGDVAAAHGYFNTTPDRLTWAEATMLAGLVQAPSAYDPLHHLELAKQRQRHVLDRLVATRVLTTAEANAAYNDRLPLRPAGVRQAGQL